MAILIFNFNGNPDFFYEKNIDFMMLIIFVFHNELCIWHFSQKMATLIFNFNGNPAFFWGKNISFVMPSIIVFHNKLRISLPYSAFLHFIECPRRYIHTYIHTYIHITRTKIMTSKNFFSYLAQWYLSVCVGRIYTRAIIMTMHVFLTKNPEYVCMSTK